MAAPPGYGAEPRPPAVPKTSLSPWGDPALRAEQEMKGRRLSARLFNQIRLPLQARAGNRPTN
jgi:hypothetical protein